jgi:hypothetical protein
VDGGEGSQSRGQKEGSADWHGDGQYMEKARSGRD